MITRKKVFVLIAAIAVLVFSIVGCTGEQGLQGPTGPRGPQGEPGPAGPGSQMWYSYENIGYESIYVPPDPYYTSLTSMPISTTFESTLIITFGIEFTCSIPNYLTFEFLFDSTTHSFDSQQATLTHEGGGLGYHSVTVIEENVPVGNHDLNVYWIAEDGDFNFIIYDWSIVAVAYPLS